MFTITEAKNKDYSGEWALDAFANFRVVEQFGISISDWFMTRMLDKMKRISNLTRQNNYVSDEKITDTLLDLSIYALMFKIYLEWHPPIKHQ